jgi:hypothetical protein
VRARAQNPFPSPPKQPQRHNGHGSSSNHNNNNNNTGRGGGGGGPSDANHSDNNNWTSGPSFLSVPDAAFGLGSSLTPNPTQARGGAGGGELPDGYGSGGSLSATLERRRLEFIMPTPPHVAPKLDDGGDGSGGGKNLHNGGGGGDGGDGGGDDDDYFGQGDGDGGEGGDGQGGAARRLGVLALLRAAVPELFDHLSIRAVLAEWYRVLADLPLAIRQAVEMGLFSSAQLTRFLSMDVRPNAARAASRALPVGAAREFIGRLMADPAFLQKAAFEQSAAFALSMAHESSVRGDRLRDELDLALINSFGAAFAAGAAVWVTAPSRSYGAAAKMPWQRMLSELPHHVFDASGPLRQFSAGQRAAGLAASTAQLAAVGAATGAATSALSSAAVAMKQRADPAYEPSSPVPNVSTSAGGLAAFMAINANLRYQAIGGLDRWLYARAAAMSVYGAVSGVARAAGAGVGELSRAWWQGLATSRPEGVAALRAPSVPAPLVAKARAALGLPLAAEEEGAAVSAAATGSEDGGVAVEKVRVRRRLSRAELERRRQVKMEQALAAAEARAAAGLAAGEAAAAGEGEEVAAAAAETEARLRAAPAVMGGGLESLRAHALASGDEAVGVVGQAAKQVEAAAAELAAA